MISINYISFLLYFLNISIVFLVIWSHIKLQSSKIKISLILLMLSSLAWINPIYLIQFPNLQYDHTVILSRFIFAMALIFLIASANFVILLTGRLQEYRKIRYWILHSNSIAVIILSFSGYVESGLVRNNFLLIPKQGPLYTYYVISSVLLALYLLLILWESLKYASDEILKYQV